MADWKKTHDIIFGGMDRERNEQSEKDTIKAVIEAIKENAGPDPQEQVQALENALYGMADGFFQEREKRREAEAGITAIQEILKKAWAEYRSPEHSKWHERAKAFFSYLGLTTGKRQAKNNIGLFHEYISLLVGEVDMDTLKVKKPMVRWEALRVLAERHKTGPEAVLKAIRRYIDETEGQNPDFNTPGKGPLTNGKTFLPGNKPDPKGGQNVKR